MKIISKYVLKEHVGPLLFAFTALTSLLLLSYIARQLGQLVGKGLGAGVIGEFLILSIPFTFAMTVPMSILVSTLYAFSRLAAENEVTACKASGISMWRLLTPVLTMGALFTIGMVLFNDQVLPRANHRLAQLQYDIVRTKPTFALKEQVINELQRERLYLRASRVLEGSRLLDVTVYDLADPTRRRTIYADSGTIAFAPNMQDLHMTLYDGVMQEVPSDDPSQLTRLYYRIDRIGVPDVGSQFQQTSQGQSKSDREMSVCEMSALAISAERRMRMAHNEWRKARVEAARGGTAEAPAAQLIPLEPGPSLGSVYCGLVTRVRGLLHRPERKAAALLRPKALHAAAVQDPVLRNRLRRGAMMRDTTLRPDSPRRSVAAESAATPAGVVPPVQPIDEGEVSAAKMRVNDALLQEQANRKEANKFLVEIHKKFALAFACFVFVLVGAPVALLFPRGGVGLTLGVSFGIFGLYYVGLISGESLADRDIMRPAFAMWATNGLMLLVGLALAMRMGRESGSNRGGGAISELVTRIQYGLAVRRVRR